MYSKEEARKLKQEFWEGFDRYTKFYSRKTGNPISWILYKTEIKGIELKFDIEKKTIKVLIEVNHKNENERFERYLELNKYKNIIEEGIVEEIHWIDDFTKPEGVQVSQICIEKAGLNFHNKDHWRDIFKFMAENMYQLQTNFEDIQPLLKEKFK